MVILKYIRVKCKKLQLYKISTIIIHDVKDKYRGPYVHFSLIFIE